MLHLASFYILINKMQKTKTCHGTLPNPLSRLLQVSPSKPKNST